MTNPLMTEAELQNKLATWIHKEEYISEEYWREDVQAAVDLITEQSRAYAETIVTTALKNLKSIEYPPSGKEYHFTDGSWSNSLTSTVSDVFERQRNREGVK